MTNANIDIGVDGQPNNIDIERCPEPIIDIDRQPGPWTKIDIDIGDDQCKYCYLLSQKKQY